LYTENRQLRSLKESGLLLSPLVPSALTIKAEDEDYYYYLKNLEDNLPSSRRSSLYQCSFDAYRAFYSSINAYWKHYERPRDLLRNVKKLRIAFLRDPDYFCRLLKELFNSFRAEVISGCPRTNNSFNYFYPVGAFDFNKLQASACLRALPQYTGEVSSILDETVNRWCTAPSIDLANWKEWVKGWTDYYRPYHQPDFFSFVIGEGACLEFSRKQGGVKKALLNIMNHSLSPKYEKMFDSELLRIKRISLGSVDIEQFRRTNYLIYACLTILEPAIQHCLKCDEDCKLTSSHPPLCCIAVKFRGYKTRIPTMTISPVVILSKVLRQVADGYLRSDPRIVHSLEGITEESLFSDSYGLWRSQDLTIATDMHAIEMTRSFYRCINPGVQWWDDAVNVVCNKYTIFTERDLFEYRDKIQSFSIGHYSKPLEFFLKDKFFVNLYGDLLKDKDFVYSKELTVEANWSNIHSRIGQVTKRGQPMGISSSWPILPLVSLFSFETSSHSKKIVITRKIITTVDTFDNIHLTSAYKKVLPKTTLSRIVPVNYNLIRTTGDDAIMRISLSQSLRHTKQIESLGSVVSKDKDFLSHNYAIYTEIFYYQGMKLPIYPLGPICGAFQDNKKLTWYNQPATIHNIEKKFHCYCKWKLSPYYKIWKAVGKMGGNVGADPLLDGLGLPRGPSNNIPALSYRARLLRNKELKNLLGIDDSTPLIIDQSLGQMTVAATDPVERSLRFMKEKSYKSIARRTVLEPSPRISIPLVVWDAIWRTQFTWGQLYSCSFQVDEPSIYEYIQRSKYTDYSYDIEEINEFLMEAKIDLETTIDIPIGYYHQFKPTFGLLLPRSQCPMFFYQNKEIDMRTSYIRYSEI